MKHGKQWRRLSAIGAYGIRLWAFLKEVGLTGWTAGMIMAGLIAVTAWLRDRLPLSVVALMALFAFAIFAFAYHQFTLSNRISRFNPAKAKQFGRQLTDFARDAHRTLVDWEQRNPRPLRVAGQDPHGDWQIDRDRGRLRALAFQERHMSQAVAYVVTLHGLGISPPFQAAAGASSRPEGLISYIGAVGHLLESGLVEEARAMNDDRPQGRALPFHLLS